MIPVSFDITLFIVAMLGAVVAVGMALMRQVLLYTGRKAVAAAELKNAQLRKRQEQMQEQHRRIQDRIRDAEVDAKSMQGQIAEVQRRIKLAEADNYVIVHELGDTGGRQRLFTGTLGLGATLTVNKSTAKDSHLRGVRHLLEVWAPDEATAMDLARRTYPAEAGFIVSRMQGAGAGGAGQTAAAMPAATAPVVGRAKPMVRGASAAAAE